ncbi:TBC1 domain family member 10B [Poecilia formosa]|uniref:TBC1 domain family, member 10b n=1 Tax=Poecilia formosa TaxID=48698 RepID=A0A087Y6I2_POEFO|nr:PREDICTED: TBC1 domain family member 10B [Poecilia formosa]XP_016531892.1 PREDICTED: TBC1 domain family member 10B [Poecilia formosa]
MAELSTLPPSPPQLGDPSAAPASSCPDSVNELPLPKSSLYNDKALTGNTSSALSRGPTTTAQPETEEPAGKNQETATGGQSVAESGSSQPAAQIKTTQEPLSPDLNPGPNLYPSVHVSSDPDPVVDVAQPQTSTDFNPATSSTDDQEKPQPPPQAQKPQNELPPPPSPNPDPVAEELPTTSTRAAPSSPTLPVIQEPVGPLSYPKPKPAPDTLSYLDSASLMSGTLESLSGLGEDGSSVGSDSEINGLTLRRTDKYGFLGGNQYSDSGEKEVRVEVARQRELKWLDMFCHWDKWVKHRFQKVKLRCRKGIPSSLRSKAWQLLSDSQELLEANPGKFDELEREPGEAKWLDIIEKDLHRQFPFHEMFAARGGHGQQDLYRILKAYTVYRPDEGYCQAQAPVAAVLLMHMPAEQAFWCLVQICEKYLPGYYSAGLEAIQLDGEIFFSLLRRTCPMAYRHLKKFKIDPILYMTEWFMCIFSRTLPWSSVLRVWDMFFCEGVKIIFRVGLVLLKQMLGSVDKLRELQGMYETMERLRNISPDTIREDVLVQEIIMLPVTEALIEKECSVQVRKWKESRGELTHKPGRRLHGTRAIFEYKRRASSISSGGSFSFLGSSAPPPGPLRASSSLLSLPGFRKSRAPFFSQPKKISFSGPSGAESQSPVASLSGQKPPIPPSAAPKATTPHVQSPLAAESSSAQIQPAPPNTLSPKIVSEQITPTIPSPTANNAPLQPQLPPPQPPPQPPKETTPSVSGEDEGKKKKKSKEDKKKEKEDEKKKMKEKKEKEKVEKEKAKKEKEKKKAGKKKDKGTEENGATAAAKDST